MTLRGWIQDLRNRHYCNFIMASLTPSGFVYGGSLGKLADVRITGVKLADREYKYPGAPVSWNERWKVARYGYRRFELDVQIEMFEMFKELKPYMDLMPRHSYWASFRKILREMFWPWPKGGK